MIVATNLEYKRKRRRLTRYTFAAFILMFVAVMASFFFINQVSYVSILAWILVIVSYFISSIGRQVQFDDGIGISTENRLAQALAALNNRYWLGNYVPVESKTLRHILVGPEGILVLETRNHTRQTRYQNGKWIRKSGFGSRIFGTEPPIGDPGRDLEEQIRLVREKLKEGGFENVPVNGAVVFTSGDTILVLEDCPVTTMTIKQLQRWSANHKVSSTVIEEPTRRAVIDYLTSLIPELVPEEDKTKDAKRKR